MTRLYLALDAANEMCLWEARDADDEYPRCVARESDVDPVAWSLIVGNLRVEIPRPQPANTT